VKAGDKARIIPLADEQPCPFCGGAYQPVDLEEPDGSMHGALLHTTPPCAQYLQEDDITAFMKAARLERERLTKALAN
jgi:hypothetical protein